jgi:ribonuclease D
MRTTLELDDRLVVAAKARARKRGVSLGTIVSELALSALADEEPKQTEELTRNGLVLLPRVAHHVVTDDMVADALADD